MITFIYQINNQLNFKIMATKRFKQMSTKKLSALMETVNEAEKAEISEILNARAAEEASAEEASAEANYMYNIGHKCEVVPFNSLEWLTGIITGVVREKRANKFFYTIQLNNGKRIVKVCSSSHLKISDEIVNYIPKRQRKSKAVKWTDETMKQEIERCGANVGKIIKWKKYDTEDGTEYNTGRIIGITPDKRASVVLYRVAVTIDNVEKVIHKSANNNLISIEDDFDKAGLEISNRYRARYERAVQRESTTPEMRVLEAEEALKKAEELLKKAEERVETMRVALEKAKADAKLALEQAEA